MNRKQKEMALRSFSKLSTVVSNPTVDEATDPTVDEAISVQSSAQSTLPESIRALFQLTSTNQSSISSELEASTVTGDGRNEAGAPSGLNENNDEVRNKAKSIIRMRLDGQLVRLVFIGSSAASCLSKKLDSYRSRSFCDLSAAVTPTPPLLLVLSLLTKKKQDTGYTQFSPLPPDEEST